LLVSRLMFLLLLTSLDRAEEDEEVVEDGNLSHVFVGAAR
jgi:hypothetical protein